MVCCQEAGAEFDECDKAASNFSSCNFMVIRKILTCLKVKESWLWRVLVLQESWRIICATGDWGEMICHHVSNFLSVCDNVAILVFENCLWRCFIFTRNCLHFFPYFMQRCVLIYATNIIFPNSNVWHHLLKNATLLLLYCMQFCSLLNTVFSTSARCDSFLASHLPALSLSGLADVVFVLGIVASAAPRRWSYK